MKRLIVTLVGSLVLMAGNAFAGGGCDYGSHAAAVAETQSPVLAAVGDADTALLAKLLKQHEDTEALEKLLGNTVVYN